MDSPTGVWLAARWQTRTLSWASVMACLSQVYRTTIIFNIATHIWCCLIPQNKMQNPNKNLFPVVSAEVEMTAYGLLTYTLSGDVASALPVVKWLSQQRNALGGFSSTQVALFLWLVLSFGSTTFSSIIQDLMELNKNFPNCSLCSFSKNIIHNQINKIKSIFFFDNAAMFKMTVFSKTEVTENKLLLLKIKYILWIPKLKCKIDLFQTPVQDTCVALQALSEYAILSYVGGVNLTISLASTNLDFQETFELNRDNKKLLQSAKVITSTDTVNSINYFFYGKHAPQCFYGQMRHDKQFATLLSSDCLSRLTALYQY